MTEEIQTESCFHYLCPRPHVGLWYDLSCKDLSQPYNMMFYTIIWITINCMSDIRTRCWWLTLQSDYILILTVPHRHTLCFIRSPYESQLEHVIVPGANPIKLLHLWSNLQTRPKVWQHALIKKTFGQTVRMLCPKVFMEFLFS